MGVKMTYTGPDGDVNYDVAAETGGSARMKSGETYDVSEGLAKGLLGTAVWRSASATNADDDALRRKARFGETLAFLTPEQMKAIEEGGLALSVTSGNFEDADVVALPGIGPATVEKIRAAQSEQDVGEKEPPDTGHTPNDEKGGE